MTDDARYIRFACAALTGYIAALYGSAHTAKSLQESAAASGHNACEEVSELTCEMADAMEAEYRNRVNAAADKLDAAFNKSKEREAP